MERIRIKAGRFEFVARFESEKAPKTCAKFRSMLPYKERIIHVRWSGEGCWIPLGDLDLGLAVREPHQLSGAGRDHPLSRRLQRDRDSARLWRRAFCEQSRPARRQPFSDGRSKAATNLRPLGEHVLWHGAQDILFEAI